MNAPTVAPVPTKTKQAQYDELVARFAELSEAEEKELLKLKKELKTIKEQRGGEIDKLKAKINELNASLSELFNTEELKAQVLAVKDTIADLISITDLFTTEELKAQVLAGKYAIADLFSIQQIAELKKTPGKGAGSGRGKGVTKDLPSDNNPILFHFYKIGMPKEREFTYHIGRIYDGIIGSSRIKTHGISVEELAKFLPKQAEAHAVAVAHLQTPEGAAEVAKIIALATGNTVTADKVAADLKSILKADKKAEDKKAA